MAKRNDTVFINLEPLSYNVAITVMNEHDKVLKDAIVSLSAYGAMMSDVAGLVIFEKVLPGNNMVYSVSRLGYRDTANILNVVDEDVSLSVILKDDGSGLSDPSIKIGSIDLFPVPAKNYVIVSSGKNGGELSVYSMSGIALYNEAIMSENTRIDCSLWQAGLYIVRMKDTDGGFLSYGKIKISR